MDKFLRNSLGIAFLIIALSVAYYLVIFLPSKEQKISDQETLKILQQQTNQQSEQSANEFEKEALKECQTDFQDRLANDEEFKKTLSNIKGTVDDAKKFMDLYLETCLRNKGYSYK